MELIIGTIMIVTVLVVLAAVRVSRIASWRAVVQIAVATGSLKACAAFIHFCERL